MASDNSGESSIHPYLPSVTKVKRKHVALNPTINSAKIL